MVSSNSIIAVDLDGTLIRTDLLFETWLQLLKNQPWLFFHTIFWLIQGKARLKCELAERVAFVADALPYHTKLIDWLTLQKTSGARLALVTASHQILANQVVKHLGIFDEVMATTDDVNLSGDSKRDALNARYGKSNYAYVGNSMDDFPVWQDAKTAHVAWPLAGVLERAQELSKTGEVFVDEEKQLIPFWRIVLKAMRLHQWLKNVLIFVPLLAAHQFSNLDLLMKGFWAFLAFGFCASGIYLLNDLLDIQDDRRHATKRHRMIASGLLSLPRAVLLSTALLVGAFALSLLYLNAIFTLILAGYLVVTSLYSFWLKRIPMLDVVTLALLYTLRVIAGAMAMGLLTTFWILAFCMFIFLSLAFVKRYTELRASTDLAGSMLNSRGYNAMDTELLASLGASSGYLSVLVMALYIHESSHVSQMYTTPQWMWLACPLLLFWLSRVWLLAHRGLMHDDPIVFAIKDGASRWIGLLFLTSFALAKW